MTCPSCGTENRASAKFCVHCGTRFAGTCPSCGSPWQTGERFCAECGAALAAAGDDAGGGPVPAATERRLVSVLFADLVGFTSLSERRDSEQVRELQSLYFASCRRLIELYGGMVEKFIGDAVMAVWGTPTATEDDAERAVRAALDLLAAVTALGDETGLEELRARAGVLTGEATVTIGAQGEGMVTGDLVNTASRVQSLAAPGQVLVGDTTRRATEPTIVYEDAGEHELKGKAGLHKLWRAVRVVSGARGALKSEGLEAPFVGRDRELRQIKDLFHASADERKAHLVSVTGIAGIGKSRLVWEFYKYFDGLPQVVYWHRGRCLSYGEGVTYWALADMVRMRCRIAEDEDAGSALGKLSDVLDEHIADADEHAFVEPRVAHLLGLSEESAFAREELFAAWRVFFERLADVNPVVLAFEDMQWADASLLDFVEHLLEWARNSPLFVVTAARPELVEKRPTWGAGKRNFTSIYLEPLSEPAMRALLSGLVPGLPEQLARQILDRAEGVPLYAMETVRMLLDRNLLVQEGSIYRPAGEVESLEVPETLQALIAARLDGLSAAERRLVQDGAVLGKTFTKQALAALSDTREEELAPVLASLVRKEVLSIQADPRSPEHGQYGFLQDLVRHVAYETLSWRDRHTRHLAAAAYLERAFPDDDEIVEVLASHYLDAYRAAPEGGPEEVKSRARELLQRAAARAGSLGAPAEAQRYYVQAAELSDPGLAQAILLDRAAEMAVRSADQDGAVRLAEAAHVLFEQAGDHGAAARASGRIAAVEQDRGQMNEAIARMAQALEVLRGEPVGEDLALLAARLGRSYWFAGQVEKAAECSELALEIGEALGLPEPLVQAWMTKAMVDSGKGRLGEARVLMRGALELALEHGLGEGASVAAANLSDLAFHRDRYTEALELLEQSGEQARRLGDRPREWFTISEATYALYQLGRWDEALAAYFELPEEMLAVGGALISPLTGVLELHVNRGDLAAARSLLAIYSRLERSVDVQERGGWTGAVAAMRVAEGAYAAALAAGREALEFGTSLGFGSQSVKQGWLWSAEAASALGDRAAVEDLLSFVENLPPGRRPRLLEAHALRISARVAADQEADRLFRAAAVRFRDIGLPFWMAVTLLERVERTLSAGEGLAEAVEIFTRLGAEPWLERARAASGHPRLAAAPGAAD